MFLHITAKELRAFRWFLQKHAGSLWKNCGLLLWEDNQGVVLSLIHI